jgi:adenine-specific DNA methylase
MINNKNKKRKDYIFIFNSKNMNSRELEQKIVKFLDNLPTIVFLSSIVSGFADFYLLGAFAEIFKKGSTEVLITLAISSFGLASLPLQLSEKHKEIKVNISESFIIAALLISLGFILPFLTDPSVAVLFQAIFFLVTVGTVLFVVSCIRLLMGINKIAKVQK